MTPLCIFFFTFFVFCWGLEIDEKKILNSSFLEKEKVVGDKIPKGIIGFCFVFCFFFPFKTSKYYIKGATEVQLFFFFFPPYLLCSFLSFSLRLLRG